MSFFQRALQLHYLTKQNVFLRIPRKVGKSSWIKKARPDAVCCGEANFSDRKTKYQMSLHGQNSPLRLVQGTRPGLVQGTREWGV
jgi:hypothetical protein